jgi:hypothetical protein
MNKRDKQLMEDYARKVALLSLQKWELATVMAMHKEFGFGEKRLDRMIEAIKKEVESITSGWIGFEDYKEYVYENTGFKLEKEE